MRAQCALCGAFIRRAPAGTCGRCGTEWVPDIVSPRRRRGTGVPSAAERRAAVEARIAGHGETVAVSGYRRRRQLVSSDEAVSAVRQHTKPCDDCPWSPAALPGWLGGTSARDWLREAHGEARIECHTLTGAQCAGAAIYRANVVKLARDPALLRLPADRTRVFGRPADFLAHHGEDE